MKVFTPSCLYGAMLAIPFLAPERLAAQDDTKPAALPSELTEMMSEYAFRRNQALIEFNRAFPERFEAREAGYRAENRKQAADAARNKAKQLKKEIQRLRLVPAEGFVILTAKYGSPEKRVNCLDPLLGQVRENGLRITVRTSSIGSDSDPHFGVKKRLDVTYFWKGEIRAAAAVDGRLLELPEREE